MKFRKLSLHGAFEICSTVVTDERGFFARTYCQKSFSKMGLNVTWPQSNISETKKKATVRGLHIQRAPYGEIKLVRCVAGHAFDVVLDLREGSPTYGKHETVHLDASLQNAIYIPEGCAHGFQALLNNTVINYMVSQQYTPEYEDGIHPLDPDLNVQWPLPPNLISKKDQSLKGLKAFDPYITAQFLV